ncbi:MAG: MarR family transcriptional regulator [Bacillota bacterium]
MEVKEAVLKTLADSAELLKAGDIAEKAELDKKEVNKVIKDLKKEEKIVSPKRCLFSSLKELHPSL